MTPSSTIRTRFENLALQRKILFPFFLILAILGIVGIYGTQQLIRQVMIETADQRLRAIQEVVYREIKKQELLLLTYANMVEYQQYMTNESGGNPDLVLLQDNLLNLLTRAKITATLYPAEGTHALGLETLSDLFRQTILSGKPRFRFMTEAGSTPSLSVAVPLSQNGRNSILLLQTPIDSAFLKQIVAPFNVDATIFSLDRKALVRTGSEVELPGLADEELARIAAGQRLNQTIESNGSHRQLFSAVPLGSSDMLLLAVDLPLVDLDLLVRTLATRAGVTIILLFSLGCWFYYRLIRDITAPLKELLQATDEVSKGQLSYRIETTRSDEFSQLGLAFNHMLERLETVYRQQAEQEKELALAGEQLHFKEILEHKNQEIERTNRELKVHLREISMLLQLNQVMNSTLDLSIMFDRTLGLLRDILGMCELALLLYVPETEELEVRKTLGAQTARLTGVAYRIDEGITGLSARTRELVYIHDVSQDPRYQSGRDRIKSTGAMISAPLLIKNRLVGVLNLYKDDPDAFSETELKLIRAATNHLAVAIENARLYETTRQLSNTDELTGVANRRYFQNILGRDFAQAARYGAPLSLLMIDIDHFKQFNDTYGHINGDGALQRVATLLLQNTRGIDLVARYGGEEFVVILPNTGRDGVRTAAEKLRIAIESESFTATGSEQPCRLTISLGAASFPTDCDDYYQLLERADQALYSAKERGRNRTELWESPTILTA